MDITRKKNKQHQTGNHKSESDIFLKKHVGLIHCENKLTLIQRKICNILLFNALDTIHDQEIHQINLQKLCSLVGYNSNDSKLIKDAIKRLISIVMEWNLLEDSKFLNEGEYSEEEISWNASALLAGASIKRGVISYSYSPQIKTVLSSLDIYGRINLFVQAKFNSTYSLVLYENCVRFKSIHQTSWMSIDLFRSLMGVPKDKYPAFKEFKRNVINVAVKEVNEKSDIYIEPQFKKTGRTISAIQFLISENKQYQPSFKKVSRTRSADASSSKPQQSSLKEILLSEFMVPSKQADQISDTYSPAYIAEKIQLIRAKKNIENPAAYIQAALKNDYKENKQAIPIQKAKSATTYLREAKAASEIASLKNQYMSYKLKMYLTFIKKQTKNTQSAIYEKFEHLLESNHEVSRFYKKSGLTSPFVMAEFIVYVDQHFPDIVGEHLDFDDYITSDEIQTV